MRPYLVSALAVLAAGPALAEPAAPLALEEAPMHALVGDGRYQLMEINDKIVRLDTATGRFELCRLEGVDWKCLLAEDERDRLDRQIADLTKRVAALEKARMPETVAAVSKPVPPPPAPVVAAPAQPERLDKLAEAVPPVDVGRSEGQPMVIAPAPEKPGLVRRITKRVTGWLPDFGW